MHRLTHTHTHTHTHCLRDCWCDTMTDAVYRSLIMPSVTNFRWPTQERLQVIRIIQGFISFRVLVEPTAIFDDAGIRSAIATLSLLRMKSIAVFCHWLIKIWSMVWRRMRCTDRVLGNCVACRCLQYRQRREYCLSRVLQ
jgi:hypothetical protein